VQQKYYLIFLLLALEGSDHGPQISVFVGLTPKIYGNIVQSFKRHNRAQKDAFWTVVGPDRTRCAV